jgi:hypothetical protein
MRSVKTLTSLPHILNKWSFCVFEYYAIIHDQFCDMSVETYIFSFFLSFPFSVLLLFYFSFLSFFISFFVGCVCDELNFNLKSQVFWNMTLCGLISHVSDEVWMYISTSVRTLNLTWPVMYLLFVEQALCGRMVINEMEKKEGSSFIIVIHFLFFMFYIY